MAFDPDLAHGILNNIGEFWQKEELSDLKITIGDHQFSCHRFQLCACSAFFQVLLRSENKEAMPNYVKHVTIQGISPATFAVVLRAIYKGENGLNRDNMIEVWHAACELHIDILTLKCEEFVMNHMSLENYQSIYQSAVLLGSRSVLEAVLKFMAGNFESFKCAQIFLDMPGKFLVDIVGSDGLVVESHDNLVDSILTWTRHAQESIDEDDVNITNAGDKDERVQRNVNNEEARNTEIDAGEKIRGSAKIHQERNYEKSVEAIFDAPPQPLSNISSMRQLRLTLWQPAERIDWLGKLLRAAKLAKASRDCLADLEKSDLVMLCKEARNVIRQAKMMSEVGAETFACDTEEPKRAREMSEGNEIDHVMVFVPFDPGNIIFAYNLDTDKIYILEKLDGQFDRDFNTCINYLGYSIATVSHKRFFCSKSYPSRESFSVPWDAAVKHYLHFGSFICRLTENLISIQIEPEAWFGLGNFYSYDGKELRELAVWKDKLIFLSDTRHFLSNERWLSQVIALDCFNTTTRRFTSDVSLKVQRASSGLVTFFFKDQLYILSGHGMLWRVEELPEYNLRVTPHYACQGSEPSQHHGEEGRLWDFDMRLHGAAVHNEELVIFCNSSVDKTQLKSAPLGLKRMKFVYLLTGSKCYPLSLPRGFLTKEVYDMAGL